MKYPCSEEKKKEIVWAVVRASWFQDKAHMILDEFNIHAEKESEKKIVDWDRTYPLTKYYLY